MSDFKKYIQIPESSIAQEPCLVRDKCKILCLNKSNGHIEHNIFSDILSFFNEGDILVLNNSKVIKARLSAYKKESGGKLEVFLLRTNNSVNNQWFILIKGRGVKKGTKIIINHLTEKNKEMEIIIVDNFENGMFLAEFPITFNVLEDIQNYGYVPLPPYIKRTARLEDEENYQTVFAKKMGSVASPTASLHFTKDLLQAISNKGVIIKYVTLHVGYGTFSMVKNPDTHIMHEEFFEVPAELESVIKNAKSNNKKIWAVGTTVVRTLESAFDDNQHLTKLSGLSNLFIRPGYNFKVVDTMVTNFHHPETSLIYLVSAFAGSDNIINAYHSAINQNYRFLSYGDAMLIF